jgi:adenylate cyclase
MLLFTELKRRNVLRMAALYAVASWLIMQVAEVLMALAGLPLWSGQAVLALLAIGFPIALVLSWFYELTPEGLSLEKDVEAHESITHVTGRRMNYIVISLLCAAVLLFAFDKWWLRDAPAPAGYANSVAVLAFDDLSPEGDQSWFSDGLSEEIINSLAQLPELKVTARTSAFHFKGLDVPIPEIAAELGVAHVVEGSVRRAGNRMRVTAQLIKADDGFHLWSETYDRNTDDVFAVQQDIAANIATALDIYLDEERREKMFQTGTRNVQAYEAFLRGAELFWKAHDGQGLQWEAQPWFERALDYDPGFAEAYYFHGDAYLHLGNGQIESPPDADPGLKPEVALDLAFQDFDRAIEFAHNEELRVLYQAERTLYSDDWRGFRSLLDKLGTIRETSTNPIFMDFHQSDTAFALLGRAGIESNYRHYKKAYELNPIDTSLFRWAVRSAIHIGMQDEALELIERREIATGRRVAGLRRLMSFETGHYDEVLADPVADSIERAVALIMTGRQDEARVLIEESLAAMEGDSVLENIWLLWEQQLLGETKLAAELYRALDARPVLSNQDLTLILVYSGGRLIWDLEWTPNYAARLAELGVELEPYELPPPAD